MSSPLFSPSDGELYTGTVSNFQGNEPVIYKSLGRGTVLKTENSLKWLQGKFRVSPSDRLMVLFLQHASPMMHTARQISQEELLSARYGRQHVPDRDEGRSHLTHCSCT